MSQVLTAVGYEMVNETDILSASVGVGGRRDPQSVSHSFDGLCLTRSYTARAGRVSLGKVIGPTHSYFCFKD